MWSVFGTTDEIVTNSIGAPAKKSKAAVYSDGAWCGFCLKNGMRTWIDNVREKCPTCKKVVPQIMRKTDL